MPGLGAGKKIFEYLKLPDNYHIHYLYWIIPNKNEKLRDYAKRLTQQIKDENPILIGVSFGSIIIQEISNQISVKQVIIISGIKHRNELKPFYKFIYFTKIHKILPVKIIRNLELIEKLPLPSFIRKKVKLYRKFLEVDDPYYLKWGINCVLSWRQMQAPDNFVHFAGEKDTVFPIKYIKEPVILVPDGEHEMIVTKVRWFNNNLPRFLSN